MRALAACLLAALVVGGCSAPSRPGPTPSPSSTSSSPSSSASVPSSSLAPGLCPPDCFTGRRLHLLVWFDDNTAHEVGVPFPHGDWCLQPEDWTLESPGHNATGVLRTVDRGTVLWVTSSGQGRLTAVIDVTNRSTCQTFRYDPWSIDPDPADGTVDVKADGAAPLQVYLDDEQGPCTHIIQYRGATASGWSTIPEHTNGTACA